MSGQQTERGFAWLAFAMVFYLIVTGCNESIMKEQQQTPGEFSSTTGEFTTHRATDNGKDMGGVSQRPGLSIHWAGSDPLDDAVRPVDVIKTTIDRMRAEQKTDLGSDANARAMVLLMQASAVLAGEDQEIDGVPVIR